MDLLKQTLVAFHMICAFGFGTFFLFFSKQAQQLFFICWGRNAGDGFFSRDGGQTTNIYRMFGGLDLSV
jgi:hypothetical protein